MKHALRAYSFVYALLAIGFIVSCEDSTDKDEPTSITATQQIVRINLSRTEIELDNNYTLILSGASLSRTRSSCSGFEAVSASDIGIDDYAEFSYYDNVAGADYPNRTLRPYMIRLWRNECVNPEKKVQYLLDSDLDNYPDIIDAEPDNPDVH